MGLSALDAWAPDTNMIITFNIIYPKEDIELTQGLSQTFPNITC